ncbi:hypothetical protein WJX72_010824 [[Myrmecia] bisecta]|uniref:Bromo domain-containing protein n=1 Tax=[Myrmecia] bisecta TaxID=41462 RepID=A0AAW1Q279_9CHLO
MEGEVKKLVLKVLRRVMQHELAVSYFNEPVDPDALGIPEYRDLIKTPMDLGTVAKKLERDHYSSPAAMLSDVRLVWQNCHTFNEPGSEVYTACDELAELFDRVWKQARFQGTAKPGTAPPGHKKSKSSGSQPGAAKAGVNKGKPAGEPGKVADSALSHGHPLQRCLQVLELVMKEPDAEPFSTPVDAEAMGLDDYHEIVQQPMDLGTIQKRLLPGRKQGWGTIVYKSTQEVQDDVNLVWHNCRLYNEPGDPIMDMCDNVEAAFEVAWKAAGLTTMKTSPAGLPVLKLPVLKLSAAQQAAASNKRKAGEMAGLSSQGSLDQQIRVKLKAPGPGSPDSGHSPLTKKSIHKKQKTAPPPQQAAQHTQQAWKSSPPVQHSQHAGLAILEEDLDIFGPEPLASRAQQTKQAKHSVPHQAPKPGSEAYASGYRCEACRKAKKGKCGTESAPLKCALRAANGLSTESHSKSGASLKAVSQQSVSQQGSPPYSQARGADSDRHYPAQRSGGQEDMYSDEEDWERPRKGQRAAAKTDDWQLQESEELLPPETKADRQVLAAFAKLQKDRQKAREAIAAAEQAVKELVAARAVLQAIERAEDEQAALDAVPPKLEHWPPNARLVPLDYQPPVASQAQVLHPDIANTAAYWLASPSPGLASLHGLDQPSSRSSALGMAGLHGLEAVAASTGLGLGSPLARSCLMGGLSYL